MVKMIKKILNKRIDTKKLSIILMVIFIISIIPMLILAFYNYPSADDFAMAVEVHQTYAATGSIFKTIGRDLSMAWHYYTNWTGYYTADLMMAMPPSVFGERCYVITTFILIGMFVFGTMYFMRALFVKLFKADKYLVRCITFVLMIVSIQCMPQGQARVEAFYWYAGAINYFFLYGLGLVYLGLLISAVVDNGNKKRTFDIIAATIIGFLMGGANYMSALSCAIISGIVLVISLAAWFKKIKAEDLTKMKSVENTIVDESIIVRLRMLVIPSFAMLFGFACSCLAPGNKYRSLGFNTMNPIKAVMISLYYTFSYAVNQWTTWVVILGILFLIPVIWKLVGKVNFRFGHPFIVVAFLYGMTSANITPSLYAEGNIDAGRIESIFWTQYMLCLVIAVIYVVGWLRRTFESEGWKSSDRLNGLKQTVLSVKASGFMLGVAFVIMFASALSLGVNHDFYTGSSALIDVLNSSAESFASQWSDRYEMLDDESVKDVLVEPLSDKPELLFFSDINSDPEDWANLAMCEYFEKDSVRSK